VAIYERGSPMLGAQATSRTQSVCPFRTSSSTHVWLSSLVHYQRSSHVPAFGTAHLNAQILTTLSHPALANRFTDAVEEGAFALGTPGVGVISEPGRVAGAHDTALQPTL
jgi:hypothetical protein